MSRLDELIKQLCPNGVEFMKIRDIGQIKMCKRIMKSETNNIGGIPFYKIGTFGKKANSFISEETFNKYKEQYSYPKKGDILISCSGTIGRIVIFDGKPSYFQDSNIVWLEHDGTKVRNEYLKYIYSTKPWKVSTGGTIARLYNDNILDTKIPVPPLEVQNEIVDISDNYTKLLLKLKSKLSEELKARKKQYEYYRNELLNNGQYEMVELKDIISKSCSGGTPLKSNNEYYKNGNIPWVRTQDVKFNEIYAVDSFITQKAVEQTSAKWIPENCVIVSISGASAGRCAINKFKTTTNQHCLNMEIDSSKAVYKYVFYCVCSRYDELIAMKQGARGDLNSSKILSLKIPLPPINIQERIVNILDRFDKIANDISQGLPAEIELRQKQYEYYRDKLLTFKELKVNE